MEGHSSDSIHVHLENKDLWDKFNALGTEMVITKVGRRMFPSLEVAISGLKPDEYYMAILDIAKADDRRYKFSERENRWQIGDSRTLLPLPVGIFVHPMCPCSGKELHKKNLLFNKVKLTNNPHSVSLGHILLESMGRYVPRLSILTYRDFNDKNWQNILVFTFKETEFIAVTAYMNKEITKLKIENNPFARAFREDGVKGKEAGNTCVKNDELVTCKTDKETVEKREIEQPIAVTYLTNGAESGDDIQVLHVNPSSIVVTDVPPSPPSPKFLVNGSNSLVPQKTGFAGSEVNVVFKAVGDSVTTREAQETLESVFYSRTSLQCLPVVPNKTVGKSGNVEYIANSQGSSEGIKAKGDLLFKVTDVRSIRQTSISSPEKQKRSLKYRENEDCSQDQIFSGENESVKNEEKSREKIKEKSDIIKEKGSDVLIDDKDLNDARNDPSGSPQENTKVQDISTDINVGFRHEKLKHKELQNHNEENLDRNNMKLAEERKCQTPHQCELPGKVNERFSSENSKILGNNINEELTEDGKRENPASLPPKHKATSDSTTQISKLLNFVNSVSMPCFEFEGSSLASNTDIDKSKNVCTTATLHGSFLRHKRSAEEQSYVHPKMSKSSDVLNSNYQSNEIFNDQSKNRTKPTELIDKMLNSRNRQNENLKSGNSNLTFPRNNSEKESCEEKRSQCDSSVVSYGSKINHEARNENPESITTKELRRTFTIQAGVICEQVNCSSPNYSKENAPTEETTKVHHFKSLHCGEHLQQTPDREQGPSSSQKLKNFECYSNGEPSNHEETAKINSTPVGSVATGKFPVVLSAYSIHPSQFSKQQVIDLNNEPNDNLKNDNNTHSAGKLMVYPAESFCFQQKRVNQVLEKYSSASEPRKYRRIRATDSEINGLTAQNSSSVFLDQSNLNWNKTVSNPSANSHPLQYIDLNERTSTNTTKCQSQNYVDHNHHGNKGVPLQVLYTFETKMSLTRAPDPRLPEIYNPTRTTFTGFASNVICSTLPIVTENCTGRSVNKVFPASANYYQLLISEFSGL